MYHVDNKTGVATMPDIPPSESTVPQWFTEGGPGEEPTVPGSATWNIWQAELLNILAAAEVVPDKFKLNQIAESIGLLIARGIEDAELLPGISYKPRTDSLNNKQGEIAVISNKDMNTCVAGEFGLYEKATCANSPVSAGSHFYCETKSIYLSNVLIQIAWTYDGAGVLAWRNYSKNTQTWDAQWREAYDTGHKPTPADIGAAAASHTHPWSQVTEAPATATRWPAWGEVTDKPTTMPPSAHTHPWSQVTEAPATATRWPAWGEVTDKPATMPPSAHTHTAAQGNADIVAGSFGLIGTYALLGRFNSGGQVSPGQTIAGSQLRFTNAEGVLNGGTPAGTWMALGYSKGDRDYGSWNVTSFIRIA